jgi:cell division protein FtsB/GNAT superfamily N-acetyltransferase
MGVHISENTRQTVIRLWLEGKSRKAIALITGVSEGTVSNITAEWKQKLGEGDAEALRELAINMKRIGIDAVRCAQGFRISSIMKKLGINENQFKFFIDEVYEYCQRFGLTGENIASTLLAVIKLSKDIPFSKIPDYIEEKKNEKRQLEEDIKTLKENKEALEMEISAAKDLRDAALENERITTAEIREYSNFKAELRRHGLTIEEDIPKLIQLLYDIRQHGYDFKKVLSEYLDLLFIKENRDIFSGHIRELKQKEMSLQNLCSSLEAEISRHSQRLYTYDELQLLGIGIRELRILCNAIKEIASENGISYRVAIEQLFGYLEEEYGLKIRQGQREQKRSSISYEYRKINTKSKTKEEEGNNQSDNDNNHDGDIYDG